MEGPKIRGMLEKRKDLNPRRVKNKQFYMTQNIDVKAVKILDLIILWKHYGPLSMTEMLRWIDEFIIQFFVGILKWILQSRGENYKKKKG